MAVVPKDLRPSAYPGRVHAPPTWASIAPSAGGLPLSSATAVAAADDQLSFRKVKILCSFGGRILPRPSDGTLRYAGGHTRIISLRKDVSFAEFVSKMSEAVGTAAVAVKYQLPGEDLDALISVSCPEDLVNLMEEYDKLAAASPDGSFKLRAFLFSTSELASAGASLHHGAADDVDQGYAEALNGFSVSDGSKGLRSNSFTSVASSTQNSEGTTAGDATEDGTGVGMSPPFPSPVADSPHDPPRLVYVGGNSPIMAPDAAVGILGGSVLPPGMSFAARNPSWGRPEMPPMAPSFVEHHQLHYVTPQHLGMVGRLQHINVVPHTMQNYVPSGVPSPSNMPSIASHIDNLQPIQARVPNLDSPYGGKGLQSLSQLPPLPPTFTPSPHLQPQARLEDCLMCQKALPHAHSDSLIQEHGIGSPDSFGETNTMFYSQRSVPLGTGAFPGLDAENMNTANQMAGSLLPRVPDVQHVNTRPIVQPPDEENSSNQRLLVHNYEQQLVNPFQLQQHQVWETLQPPPYLIKQEIVTAGLPNEESLLLQQLQTGQQPNCMVRQEGVMDPSDAGVYSNYHSTLPTTQVYAHQFTDENVELAESRMEALRLGLPETSETTQQGKPATTHIDAPSYLVVENSHNVGPQFGDSALSSGWNYRYIVPDGNCSKPIEQGTLRSSEVIQLQRLQNEQKANMIKNHEPFPYNLGISEYAGHVNTLENIEVGHDNMMPPRPSRIASKESAAPNHRAVGSDIVSMLEEGNFHHPPDTMIKDLCFEPVRLAKEENIKQQLQAIAEGVAASVFQPPTSSSPETKKLAPEITNEISGTTGNKELDKIVPDEEIEDSMAKQLNQKNQGIHLTEDMGRLQIIKNSDLEELQELGSGTFGTVHHGKWRGTDVAIKRINDGCFSGKKSEEERMMADFWNEACKLADLHHPNVVAFYGVVLDSPGGSIATVTEYMVNGSLRQALQRNHKAFDRRQRYLIAMDVAFGMEYLHAKSIVHFDLKSDNLPVNLRDPHCPICKVGDLGLSKVKCRTLISGGMRGTLPWMAPELLYGNDSLVSEKVDVFSFGIVMWEIMTGEEPYADLHYGAIIGGILSNTLRPPVPEACDLEWRTLMEQCWSAEPSERPSFTEIANRLRCMASALSHKAQQHQAAHK